MKAKTIGISIAIASLLFSCSPYKGFKGVDKKGMGRKPPSVEVSDGYQKDQKKGKRKYKREMKRKRREYGAPTK